MLRYSALFIVFFMITIFSGCMNNHIKAVREHQIGQKIDLSEEFNISRTRLSRIKYEFLEIQDSNFEGEDFFSVGVSTDGVIHSVTGGVKCNSNEDAKRVAIEMKDVLCRLYQEGLKDCGAEESKFIIDISIYNDNFVHYSCRSADFQKKVDKNNR